MYPNQNKRYSVLSNSEFHLMKALATAATPLPKVRICELLWPNDNPYDRHISLRFNQLIHYAKKKLPDNYKIIRSSGTFYTLLNHVELMSES